jgi:hypothetical protein
MCLHRFARVGTAVGLLSLAVLGASAAKASGGPLVPPLDPFHAAVRAGRLGQVVGRAYEESLTPGGPDQPLGGVQVALVPFSAGLQDELDRLKERARTSMAAYRAAVPSIQRALEAYMEAVRAAGGADLLRTGVADAGGTFRFDRVPVGRWMLVARQSLLPRRVSSARQRQGQPGRDFVLGPAVTAHATVRIWRSLPDLSSEPATVVDLTDRNVWYTGVQEETAP